MLTVKNVVTVQNFDVYWGKFHLESVLVEILCRSGLL